MGLSPYRTPADGGVLVFFTVLSIWAVKEIVLSILGVFGLRIPSWEDQPPHFYKCHRILAEAYMEEVHREIPAVRFEFLCEGHPTQQECLVCLTEFEPHEEINHLLCGHLFHKTCLEKWFRCWHLTCPLCRTRMRLSEEEEEEEATLFW